MAAWPGDFQARISGGQGGLLRMALRRGSDYNPQQYKNLLFDQP